MTNQCENIQFLIVGASHEHIFKIINHFHPSKIYLISSFEMQDSIMILKEKIDTLNILTQIIWVNPFKKDSLYQIISKIVENAKMELIDQPHIKIYIGFTGGTNLMAIAAGYSAMILHAESHYVLKDKNDILFFQPNQILSSFFSSRNIQNMERRVI